MPRTHLEIICEPGPPPRRRSILLRPFMWIFIPGAFWGFVIYRFLIS